MLDILSVKTMLETEVGSYDVELAAAVMDGHVAAFARVFAVGKELVHEVCESEAALLKHSCLSVLGEDHVFGDQS